MSDVVIIVGTKRGKESVPIMELKQMVGRAGRKHGGETAIAHLIVESDSIEDVKNSLEQGTNMDVISSFEDIEGLMFHLNTEIVFGNVTNIQSAQNWFSRSLAAYQNKKVDMQKVLDRLEIAGAIHQPIKGRVISTTNLGKISSELYFHPDDIKAWTDNFTKLFDMGLENDNAAIAWALGTRPYNKSVGDFGDYRFVIDECRSAIPLGLNLEKGMSIQVVLWWGSMGGPPMGKMRNAMLELREDIGRIKRALIRIDREHAHWNMVSFFEDVEMMVKKGITFSLLDLCKLPGITKSRADFLYNMGVRDVEGMIEIMDSIGEDIDEQFMDTLRIIANEFSNKSR